MTGLLPSHGPPRPYQFIVLDALLDHPQWTQLRVLDVGGTGAILDDPETRIARAGYRCARLDDALSGTARGPFDVVLAYSVFTRTDPARMVAAVRRLRRLLAPGGRMAFTFLDPWWTARPRWSPTNLTPSRSNLHWCLDRYTALNPQTRLDVRALLDKATGARPGHAALGTDGALRLDPGRWHGDRIAFYTVAYVRRLFPDASIRPPVRPERQHGAVLAAQAPGRRWYQMPSTTKSSTPVSAQ